MDKVWSEAWFVQMSRRGFKGDDPGAFMRSIAKEDIPKQMEEFDAIYNELLAAKGGE
jgi:hypothetical protein